MPAKKKVTQVIVMSGRIREAAKAAGLDTKKVKGTAERFGDYGDWQNVYLDLSTVEEPVAKFLFDDFEVLPQTRRDIGLQFGWVLPHDPDKLVANPKEFAMALIGLNEYQGFNAEVKFLNRWYPIKLDIRTFDGLFGPVTICSSKLPLGSNFTIPVGFRVSESLFIATDGSASALSLNDIFKRFSMKVIAPESVERYRQDLERAMDFADRSGSQMLVYGQGVAPGRWGPRILNVGSTEAPLRAILEKDLESARNDDYDDNDGEEVKQMPFVRCFSLALKTYFWIDVNELKDYSYDTTAVERLTLPPRINSVIRSVFDSTNVGLFGDVLANRHGGMIILANGGPGVGKTLTAEVFAEYTKRPLYVMEIGEIGTDINNLEANLTTIFDRVQKWNAVLLFDEADIFLHKRGDDLQHNAVVGIFLRLMDYYRGLLFMTTNRADAIDPAFQSRITLQLDYPTLEPAARASIWKTMMTKAGIKFTDAEFATIGEQWPLNGRQIRNVARLLRVLHPKGDVTMAELANVVEFTPGMKKPLPPTPVTSKGVISSKNGHTRTLGG